MDEMIGDSYANVSSALTCALNDRDQSVIVLRGHWGTGKTHLWRKIRSRSTDKGAEIGRSIYVSLFGLKTIENLKWSILRSAYSTDKAGTNKLIQAASQIGGSWLGRFIGMPSFNTALLWLPDLLRKRLVVIDDVERKHSDLSIDELLGFLEEYTELHGTRFLLLMNDTKLTDEPIWRTLREKVVDIEIVLRPTPADAFRVASTGWQLPQLDRVQLACTALDITNIRIIRKALHVVSVLDRAVGDDLPSNPWPQSAVLLTVMHFRGLEDPPTIEFVRTFNQFSRLFRDTKKPLPEQVVRWEMMLADLGMHSADDFEPLVFTYLESGLLDEAALRVLFDRYRADAAGQQFQDQLSDFFTSLRWDPSATKQSLCDKAEKLLPHADRLGADMAGDLANLATIELGNAALGKRILAEWITAADAREDLVARSPFPIDMEITRLHPQIAEKIRSIRANAFPPQSLRAAVEHIALEQSWGGHEERALSEATAETYRTVLEEITGEELRRFVRQHAEWIKSGASTPSLASATKHFLKACRDILDAPPRSRLADIILWFFQSQGLVGLLEPPTVTAATPSADQPSSIPTD